MDTPRYFFDLSQRRHCSIESFVIKETDGEDEENAALHARAKGGAATVYEELVRQSITHVNGQRVEQPLKAYDKWSSRTRAFILQAFRHVNGVEDKEIPDFLAAANPFTE